MTDTSRIRLDRIFVELRANPSVEAIEARLPELTVVRFSAEEVVLSEFTQAAHLRAIRQKFDAPVSNVSRLRRWAWVPAMASAVAIIALVLSTLVDRGFVDSRGITSVVVEPPPDTRNYADQAPPTPKLPPTTPPKIRGGEPANVDKVVAANVIGTFRSTTGDPQVILSSGAFERAAIGAPIRAGSTIDTGDIGGCEIVLADGSVLSLTFNTRIRFGAADGNTIEQLSGRLWAKVEHRQAEHKLKVVTPTATATVLGTEFGLQIRKARQGIETVLSVLKGQVQFSNAFGAVEVGSMSQSIATAGATPTEPAKLATLQSFRYHPALNFEGAVVVVRVLSMDVTRALSQMVRTGPFDHKYPPQLRPETILPEFDVAAKHLRDGKVEAALELLQEVDRLRPSGSTANNLAVLLEMKGRHTDAAELFRTAIARDPDCAFFFINYAQLLSALGNHERALELYRKTYELSPNWKAAIGHLAEGLCSAGAFDEAAAFVRDYARSAEGWFPQALAADTIAKSAARYSGSPSEFNRMMSEAESYYKEAAKSEPRDFEFHLDYAGFLLTRGKVDEAERRAEIARGIQEDDSDLWTLLGLIYATQRKNDRAEEAYRRALALDGQNALAHYNLGNLLNGLDRSDEALKHILEALEIDPSDADSASLVGAIYSQQRDFQRALTYSKRAVSLEPNAAKTQYNLGLIYFDMRERGAKYLEEAARCFTRAFEIVPDYQDALLMLSQTKHLQGHYPEAEKLYRDLLKKAPGFWEIKNNLAEILVIVGRTEEAIVLYRDAAESEPGELMLRLALIDLLILSDDGLDEALQMATEAVENWESSASARMALGSVRIRRGEVALGEDDLKRAIVLFGSDPAAAECWYRLGFLYESQDHFHEARLAYARAVALQSQHKLARESLRRIK